MWGPQLDTPAGGNRGNGAHTVLPLQVCPASSKTEAALTATQVSGRSAGSGWSGWATAPGYTTRPTATGRASRASSSSSTGSWASDPRQVALHSAGSGGPPGPDAALPHNVNSFKVKIEKDTFKCKNYLHIPPHSGVGTLGASQSAGFFFFN